MHKFVGSMVLLVLGFCAVGAKEAVSPQAIRRQHEIMCAGFLNPAELDVLNDILGFGCGEVDARLLSVGLSPQHRPTYSAKKICERVNAHGYLQRYYFRPFCGVCTDCHGLKLTCMSFFILDKVAVAEYLLTCAAVNNNSYSHNAQKHYFDSLIDLIKRVEARIGISNVDAFYREQRCLRAQLLPAGA